MTPRRNDSIKWLIKLIIVAAFIAIFVILIVHNSAPSGTNAPIDSTPSSSHSAKRSTSTSDLSAPAPDSSATEDLKSSPGASSQSTEPAPSQPITGSQPSAPTPQATGASPSVTSSTCLHSVSGVCLDDYEDEAYSAGLYDYSYGYYGTSLDYPEGCNATCKEALEDAYDEGWYDSH